MAAPKKVDFDCQFVGQNSKQVQASATSYIVDQDYLARKQARKAHQKTLQHADKQKIKQLKKLLKQQQPQFGYVKDEKEAEELNLK